MNSPFEQTEIHKTFYWWCFVDDEMMLLVVIVVIIVAVAVVRVDADVLFSASIKVEFQLNCFMI